MEALLLKVVDGVVVGVRQQELDPLPLRLVRGRVRGRVRVRTRVKG